MSSGISGPFVSRGDDVVILHLARKASPLLEEIGQVVRDAPVCAEAGTDTRAERLELARNLTISCTKTLLQYTTL
jgi:hypothetical protein